MGFEPTKGLLLRQLRMPVPPRAWFNEIEIGRRFSNSVGIDGVVMTIEIEAGASHNQCSMKLSAVHAYSARQPWQQGSRTDADLLRQSPLRENYFVFQRGAISKPSAQGRWRGTAACRMLFAHCRRGPIPFTCCPSCSNGRAEKNLSATAE